MRTLLLLLLASLAMGATADQRPLVLSTTNGNPVQVPAGNRISLPTAAGGFYATIDPGVQTATRVFTLPVTAGGDTFDVLGTAQTISATKTFTAAQVIAPAASVDKTLSVGVATTYNLNSLKTASVFYADNSDWGFPCLFVADSVGRGPMWVQQGYSMATNTGNAAYLSLTNSTTTDLYLYQNGVSAVVPTFNIQAGKVVATGTADSSTTTSGALVSSGGLGVAKAINGGSTLTLAGASSDSSLKIPATLTAQSTRSSIAFGVNSIATMTPGGSLAALWSVQDIISTFTGTNGATSSGQVIGINMDNRINNSAGSWASPGAYNPSVCGFQNQVRTLSPFAGTISGEMCGASFGVSHTAGAGTVTDMEGAIIKSPGFTAGGTVSGSVYGLKIANQGNAAWTTSRAIRIDAQSGSTTNYAIDVAGGLINSADTTSASSSTTGAMVIGNGSAATSVAIGGGKANIGGTLTVGSTSAFADTTTVSTSQNSFYLLGSFINSSAGNAAIGRLTHGEDASTKCFEYRYYNSGYTTGATYNVANSGTIILGTGATGGMNIVTRAAAPITFYTGDVSCGGFLSTRELSLTSTTDASAIGTAALVVPGGATFAKSIGLGAIAAPGTLFLGQIWNDSTQQCLFANLGASTANRLKQSLVGTIATAFGTTGPTNSTTEGTFLTNGTTTGTFTLPANFLTVGKTLRLTIRGTLGNVAGTSITLKCKLGSVVVNTSGLTSITPANSTSNYEVSLLLTCGSTGASGSVKSIGWFAFDGAGTQTRTAISWTAGSATVDTTASQALDVTATWAAASASNYLNSGQAVLEALN